MIGFISVPFVHRRRTGAHQGHFSLQDVEKLGKLIQGQYPDPSADALLPLPVRALFLSDNARIMFHFEHELVLLAAFKCQLLFAFFRVHIHAAELVHFEFLSVFTDPDL